MGEEEEEERKEEGDFVHNISDSSIPSFLLPPSRKGVEKRV